MAETMLFNPVSGEFDLVQNLQQLADGTEYAPSLGFLNDTDTGIFRYGNNTLGITAGGQCHARFSDNGIVLNNFVHNASGGNGGFQVSNPVDYVNTVFRAQDYTYGGGLYGDGSLFFRTGEQYSSSYSNMEFYLGQNGYGNSVGNFQVSFADCYGYYQSGGSVLGYAGNSYYGNGGSVSWIGGYCYDTMNGFGGGTATLQGGDAQDFYGGTATLQGGNGGAGGGSAIIQGGVSNYYSNYAPVLIAPNGGSIEMASSNFVIDPNAWSITTAFPFYSNLTSNVSVAQNVRNLVSSSGYTSVDWENRYLQNSNSNITVDWENCKLYDSLGNLTLDFSVPVTAGASEDFVIAMAAAL